VKSGSFRQGLALAAGAFALVALAGLPILRQVLWRWESNPVLRGRRLAETQGCYDCHRQFGTAEMPNPGSRWGSVPAFAAGNAMMYADSCSEIGEFVRFGAPRTWLDDPAAAARLNGQFVRMPAFGEILDEVELADLTAFACAVEGIELGGDDTARAGRAVARKHGCLGCHGVEGSGGLPNPRSLGGFIPGFSGGNFPDLVRDEEEFRQWVREGSSPRLERNPVVRFFWRRQAIRMPAYRERLTDEELGQLWHWVESVREP
jgi:mono/diheme cytochrome c family protein